MGAEIDQGGNITQNLGFKHALRQGAPQGKRLGSEQGATLSAGELTAKPGLFHQELTQWCGTGNHARKRINALLAHETVWVVFGR